ncbi:hypothetical protein J6590_033332 [Homalodisca vitripennis]|nr:hypothetical protein J6590_033332 [Homalodisca vitripennis]
MMERFGIGVVMESWRENNIKTGEQGEEKEVEDGIRKGMFGSASACVRVRGKISLGASVGRGRSKSFSGRSLKSKLAARSLDEPARCFGVNIVACLPINVPRPHLIN